jgi:hypothetical protein
MKNFLNKGRLGITTIGLVGVLIAFKFFVHKYGFEFLSLNSLYTSAISGAVFIMGFLLAGVFGDYKEAEKAPAELRSVFESIFEDAKMCKLANPSFDLLKVKTILLNTIEHLFSGLSHKSHHKDLHKAIESLEALLPIFVEMERLGIPANHMVRLKSERANAKKILLRIEHIQRIQFVPSVYFLAESIMVAVIGLLLFLKSEGSPEAFVLFGFISYLFLYIARLIPVLEQPFRQGHKTLDDVSLFLLHDLEDKLKKD